MSQNCLLYFIYSIIILSIIILVLLLLDDFEEFNKVNELENSNKVNECNYSTLTKGIVGSLGLGSLLLISNKYFYKNKNGSNGGSYLKKSKIKSFIKSGANPVDQNFILDETYIGNQMNKLKEENINIIKLLKYINTKIDLPNDMNIIYNLENSSQILNDYLNKLNSNILYSELKKCYEIQLNKRIKELKQSLNKDFLNSSRFKKDLDEKNKKYNKDVFNRDLIMKNINPIKNGLFNEDILNNKLFTDINIFNTSFRNVLSDFGIQNPQNYINKLNEIYLYQEKLKSKSGSVEKINKTKQVSQIKKQQKSQITEEQKDQFNKEIELIQVPLDKKENILKEINNIVIENFDKDPIQLNIEIQKLDDEILIYKNLKDEFLNYSSIYTSECNNITIGFLEVMSINIYQLSYKLFSLFIENSNKYYNLQTNNLQCIPCFELVNKELNLLRNQLNSSITNYSRLNEKNIDLEKINKFLTEENTNYINQIQKLETRIEEILSEKATLKITNNELNQQIEQSNKQIEQLKQQIINLESQININSNKIQELNTEINQKNNQITNLKLEIEKNNKEINNKEFEINKLKEKNNQLVNSNNMINEDCQIKIQELNKEIQNLKNQIIKSNEEFKEKIFNIESQNFQEIQNLKNKHQEEKNQLELSRQNQKDEIEKKILENFSLKNQNDNLIDENNKLKNNISLSNEISDKIIDTISNDIQLILNKIIDYKLEIQKINNINKESLNKFKYLFNSENKDKIIISSIQNYNEKIIEIKDYLENLNNKINEQNDKNFNIFIEELNIIINFIDNINNIELNDNTSSKLIKKIISENPDIEKQKKLQYKKEYLINILKQFYNNSKNDLNKIISLVNKDSNKKLEDLIKDLEKDIYFNDINLFINNLNRLDIYDENNIYNLNLFTEYISTYLQNKQWDINQINLFKNSYIKNYINNIILQIQIYSQIIALNKIFKFTSSLIISLKKSPVNLNYFNNKLDNIKFNLPNDFIFNNIFGSQEDNKEENNVTYNELINNFLKLLELKNIQISELELDIPIKFNVLEDQLNNEKFNSINQNLTGFMNILVNKLTKLDIIKNKENLINDIIDDSNNLINNINTKYQNEINTLNNIIEKLKNKNNDFINNINNILSEYQQSINKGYNNFISYIDNNKKQIITIINNLNKQNNINKQITENQNNNLRLYYYNKITEILENINNNINNNNEFKIDLNPPSNYDDLYYIYIDFYIYIDLLLKLNENFINSIVSENKSLQDENQNLNNENIKLQKEIDRLKDLEQNTLEIKQKNQELENNITILKTQLENNKINDLTNNNEINKYKDNIQDLENQIKLLMKINQDIILDTKDSLFNTFKNLFNNNSLTLSNDEENIETYIQKIYNFVNNKINELNNKINELTNSNLMINADFQQQLQNLKSNNELLLQEIKNKNEEITKLKQQYQILQEEIKKLNEENNTIINNLQTNELTKNTELNNILIKLSNNEKKLNDLTNKFKEIQQKLLSEFNIKENLSLDQLIDKLINELKSNRLKLEKLDQLNMLNEEKDTLIDTYNQRILNLGNEKDILNSNLTKLKNDILNKNVNIFQYKTKIEILENLKIKLLTENGGLKQKIIDCDKKENIIKNQLKQIQELSNKLQTNKNLSDNEKFMLNEEIQRLNNELNKKEKELNELTNKLESETKKIQEELALSNIDKEENINKLKNIIKSNTLLVIKLRIKNGTLENKIKELQNENIELKNNIIKLQQEFDKTIIEQDTDKLNQNKQLNELKNKYILNLNELGQIKEIVNDQKIQILEYTKKYQLSEEQIKELQKKLIELDNTNKQLIESNSKEKIKNDILNKQLEENLNKYNNIYNELKTQIDNLTSQNELLINDKQTITEGIELQINELEEKCKNEQDKLNKIITNLNTFILRSNKSDEFKNIQKELTELNNKYINDINNLKTLNIKLEFEKLNLSNKIKKLEDAIKLLQGSTISIQDKVLIEKTLNSEIEILKKVINQKDIELNELKSNEVNSSTKIIDKENELNKCKLEISKLEKILIDKNIELNNLQTEIKTLQTEIKTLQIEINTLQNNKEELEKLKSNFNILNIKYIDLERIYQDLLNKNQTNQKELIQCQQDLNKCQQDLTNCQKELSNCNQNLTNCQQNLTNEINQSKTKINNLEQEIQKLKQEKLDLENKLNLQQSNTNSIPVIDNDIMIIYKERPIKKSKIESITPYDNYITNIKRS